MAFDYSRLTEMTQIGTADTTTTMYANPSSTTSYVRQVWFHLSTYGALNFSSSTIKMYVVPDDSTSVRSAFVTHAFFERSLATNDTYVLECGVPGIILVDQNDTLQMTHTSKTTVSYMVMGGIET